MIYIKHVLKAREGLKSHEKGNGGANLNLTYFELYGDWIEAFIELKRTWSVDGIAL